MIARLRLISIAVFLAGIVFRLPAQETMLTDTSVTARLQRAQRWIDAGSFHVARLELRPLLRNPGPSENYRDILLLVVRSDFADKE